jgi:hypothetical protein
MDYKPNQISITVNILFDGKYWMALFEKRDIDGYSVAKATISVGEPQGYQIEKFLNSLDRKKLQFTPPGPEPTTTKLVVVEKKQKFEKTHTVEVQLKNIHGDAKTLLHKQKATNKIAKNKIEQAENREQNAIKQKILLEKKIQKHRGR